MSTAAKATTIALLLTFIVSPPAGASGLRSPRRNDCGRVAGTRITAFNLNCGRARRIWRQAANGAVRRDWTGANLDTPDGGQALLYPKRASRHVSECLDPNGFVPAKLGPRIPVIFARVSYGE